MHERILMLAVFLALSVSACGGTPTPAPALPTSERPPTVVSPSGYRPLQAGDTLEGSIVSYHYAVPSMTNPSVVFAFGPNLLQLIIVKEELVEGLVAYIKELPKDKKIYAFDENDPTQTEPQWVSWDATKPVEIAFIPLPTSGKYHWSVTEGDGQEVEAAYKIVKRKDGGLRFIDAYGFIALQSANNTFTLNGGGTGLMFSARLALLRTILSNPQYQRGADVMATYPPALNQYDPRILLINPSSTGIAMNVDWVLLSRQSPLPGKIAP